MVPNSARPLLRAEMQYFREFHYHEKLGFDADTAIRKLILRFDSLNFLGEARIF